MNIKEIVRNELEASFIKEAGYSQLAVMDKVIVELAIEEMEKEAGLGDELWAHMSEYGEPSEDAAKAFRKLVEKAEQSSIPNSFKKGLGEAAGKSGVMLAGALTGLGIYKAHQALQKTALREKFEQALHQVSTKNYILKSAPKDKLTSFAETIYKFAPHVAGDPNILSSLLANAVHGESLDPKTIESIVQLEGKYLDKGQFNPKAYIG